MSDDWIEHQGPPDAPAGDALAAARETFRSAIRFWITEWDTRADKYPVDAEDALIRKARAEGAAEGAAEEQESCLELVRVHVGATVSGRKLAAALRARAPSSGTEAQT